MKVPFPNSQAVMNILALIILGLIAGTLVFVAAPAGNHEMLSGIIGGIIGVLVGSNVNKGVSAPDGTVNVNTPPPVQK